MDIIALAKNCEKCGNSFCKMVSTSRRIWKVQRFCSIGCSSLIEAGKPLPIHIRNGMNNAYKKQMEQLQKGERNNNWRGGKSYAFRKKAVLLRDNYTCVMCGHREQPIMEVDHIKPKRDFPELALEMNNLVTLCPNCHRRKTNRELIARGQNPSKQVRGF